MTWRTVSSRTAYENPWIRVREDTVLRPDGGEGTYGVLEVRRPSVFVVALDDDDRLLLVTVDRYTTGPGSLEVPGGGTDGDAPLDAARRELLEETGLEAAEWTPVGRMEALNGIAEAPEHVFLARGLRPAVTPAGAVAASQEEEGISDVRWVPFGEALGLVAAGEVRDGETIAALALAGIHLGRFA
ncbi:NUDIX domain-containing protein [Antribacter gilvus]|uniref:NUDIX domain-containing protein n=1 Tax=Antribacter gilvus TaxID=2304675 RepID=UPI000F7B34BB|nr:NUDIX hydrolase [Antribacter gilvus]